MRKASMGYSSIPNLETPGRNPIIEKDDRSRSPMNNPKRANSAMRNQILSPSGGGLRSKRNQPAKVGSLVN